jgi:hypothetical protein
MQDHPPHEDYFDPIIPRVNPASQPPADPAVPWADLDLDDADTVVRLFQQAAAANRDCPLRRGAAVHLPARGRLVMTGDLHDHSINLQRILTLAALHEDPDHHVILHEAVHGPNPVNGLDLSVRTVARVAAAKVRFPGQVHLLQSNHELAQLLGEGIMKISVNVVEAFDAGLMKLYGGRAEAVHDALQDYILSLLLAVRCDNRLFCCHSLPSPAQMKRFDPDVIHRDLTEADLRRGGSAHLMVWGRDHTRQQAQHLADLWDVDLFLCGHQPAEMGYEIENESIMILASDHEHGMALPVNLTRPCTMHQLEQQLVPLAGVTL